ncbi:hypothetical protein GCM10010282_36900 [Streptomyces roseolus]|nr:hypothetical protein GCM10010282_36900 [Streptomyces roseolus]
MAGGRRRRGRPGGGQGAEEPSHDAGGATSAADDLSGNLSGGHGRSDDVGEAGEVAPVSAHVRAAVAGRWRTAVRVTAERAGRGRYRLLGGEATSRSRGVSGAGPP